MMTISFAEKPLIEHMADLFPLPRSLSGHGQIKTLEYFEKYFPELQRLSFQSGTKVFDWTIPLEWNVKDAYFQNLQTGKKYADFHVNNLHLVGYSEPINTVVDLDELQRHLYSLPDTPYWVPYVTSYYSRNWGFCINEITRSSLPAGDYRIFIQTTLQKGSINISHAQFKGQYQKEIFSFSLSLFTLSCLGGYYMNITASHWAEKHQWTKECLD